MIPTVAHPERNPEIKDRLSRAEKMVAAATLVQLKASPLEGRGAATARTAFEFGRRRGDHRLTNDAHAAFVRLFGLAGVARAFGDEALARYLTVEAQDTAGGHLPSVPVGPR